MPVVLATVAVVGGSVVVICSAPYLAAEFFVRTSRIVFRNKTFRREARQLLDDANHDMAAAIFSESMRAGFREAMVNVCSSDEFHQAFTDLVGHVMTSQQLKDTIKSGVLEALMDEQFNAQVKSLLVANLLDEELQAGISKAVIATVKTGIREGLKDEGLKEVLTVALRDSLEDPRLKNVLYDVLKDALANKDLHRATFQGVVRGLNPFKQIAPDSESVSRENSPPRARALERLDGLQGCRDPQIQRSNSPEHESENFSSPRTEQSERSRIHRSSRVQPPPPQPQSNLIENITSITKIFSPEGSRS